MQVTNRGGAGPVSAGRAPSSNCGSPPLLTGSSVGRKARAGFLRPSAEVALVNNLYSLLLQAYLIWWLCLVLSRSGMFAFLDNLSVRRFHRQQQLGQAGSAQQVSNVRLLARGRGLVRCALGFQVFLQIGTCNSCQVRLRSFCSFDTHSEVS